VSIEKKQIRMRPSTKIPDFSLRKEKKGGKGGKKWENTPNPKGVSFRASGKGVGLESQNRTILSLPEEGEDEKKDRAEVHPQGPMKLSLLKKKKGG